MTGNGTHNIKMLSHQRLVLYGLLLPFDIFLLHGLQSRLMSSGTIRAKESLVWLKGTGVAGARVGSGGGEGRSEWASSGALSLVLLF